MEYDSRIFRLVYWKRRRQLFFLFSSARVRRATKLTRKFVRVTFRETKVDERYSSRHYYSQSWGRFIEKEKKEKNKKRKGTRVVTIVTLSCSKSQKHRSKLRDLINDVGNSNNPSEGGMEREIKYTRTFRRLIAFDEERKRLVKIDRR